MYCDATKRLKEGNCLSVDKEHILNSIVVMSARSYDLNTAKG